MLATETSPVLAHTVGYVLETMCFSETAPCSENFSEEDVIGTTVAFSGTLSGCLQLETTKAAARGLATSFLGLTASDTMASDMICELGNVICGRFLSLVEPGARVKIDTPVKRGVIYSGDITWHNFRSDCGPLRVAFKLN
jgi:CheY-specific phosphatase CheX